MHEVTKTKGALQHPNLEEQERYWDWWQETRTFNPWSQRRSGKILELLEALSLDRPKILDFGCGTGWFTESLARLGDATGIDLSKKALAQASARYPHAKFVSGDLFEYPFPSEAYDVVVSQQVLAHVEDQEGYIAKAAYLLKPGGYFLLTINNKFVLNRMEINSGPEFNQEHGHIENWLSMREIRRLLGRHFHILKTISVIPIGNRGVLRLINSHKLTRLLGYIFSPGLVEKVKEQAGLGYVRIILAQKGDMRSSPGEITRTH